MYNSVAFVGNIGKEPEKMYTPGGVLTLKTSLAVNQGQDKDTMWFDLTFWGRDAENAANFIHKGTRVLISGKLAQHRFSRRDGTDGSSLSISVKDWVVINRSNAEETVLLVDDNATIDGIDDEIPF